MFPVGALARVCCETSQWKSVPFRRLGTDPRTRADGVDFEPSGRLDPGDVIMLIRFPVVVDEPSTNKNFVVVLSRLGIGVIHKGYVPDFRDMWEPR